MLALMEAARPFAELRAEAFSAEARKCLAKARTLLHSPDVLDQLKGAIRATCFAGDTRPAMMSYFAITSRLLQAPLNLGYISQSASGKNAGVDASLPFFPKTSFYLVRASSPRALIYNDEQFTHRTVILTEADSLPEHRPAALRPAAQSSEVAWGSSAMRVSCTRKALEPFEPYSHSATAQL
ncbi:MAG: hypothetical protein QGI49_09275 [SAR202 cluster bacterium]|jgi:hypothetical protein|nr:hypothetical protein [SAR202 cluster bacterium]